MKLLRLKKDVEWKGMILKVRSGFASMKAIVENFVKPFKFIKKIFYILVFNNLIICKPPAMPGVYI